MVTQPLLFIYKKAPALKQGLFILIAETVTSDNGNSWSGMHK